ncbi:acetyl-CoA carboxylase carboxyl transferase subunit alpha/beta [Candidatus Epulonipiscium fishelsonii]|uniref:Acetyl-CoA carboxylase carboxyl transferase subunit alpha/beta n=1 Tax=Candidatus Epulonipiscium fishelsonii TaxID=77094 RepID=A0ACC8XBD3_9FIRM|nr:acetyl-CoA carboxylase carboxyl transferase subunit alpha/beta [Epulopiscium sp. SCG-B11WGA-EpuloA1]ONI41989.1 acetyl-CoA carboxylase carboxyl transferase subunit alpha/beta [Epulopiscium sp. SCG-B05WGA-EpuloA1]
MFQSLMNRKKYGKVDNTQAQSEDEHKKVEIPAGMYAKCPHCKKSIYIKDLADTFGVCTNCEGYFPIAARIRINSIVDKDSFIEFDKDLESRNPLNFKDYGLKLESYMVRTNEKEAVLTGRAKISNFDCMIAVMDSRFMMGSMGEVVGEKITRAIEYATENKLPIIIFCASGGARMQEGIFSLMQMAKTSAALAKHDDEGLLYISVLTNPTTGGVTASFAMLGDIILSEPQALIGFAGPRVIEQTIKQKLPNGFQKAEFLLEHGMIDKLVERKDLAKTLGTLLKWHLEPRAQSHQINEKNYLSEQEKESSPWEKIAIARQIDRPRSRFYIEHMFEEFIELHGDRAFADDKAIIGGIGTIGDNVVTIIAQNKGKTSKENIEYNFGMPHPEGYRKSFRLMKQAEKFHRPIICLIDTPGAYCGLGAEERGQGEAIARNLMEMSRLKTPIIAGVIGEGGSGGALALGVADFVFMQQNTTYSILSPEGFASILWKDSKLAEKASTLMKITPTDLLKFGIIDDIIKEPSGGAHKDPDLAAMILKNYLLEKIQELDTLSEDELVKKRYERFRKYGNINQ